ncbi:MAG: hypothetical protein EPN30_06855 [Actinomycetota bacterium]|nr:MAG: hypothetical protein EPN30_06855 [Actinomycetota bacterium]
MKLPKLTNIGAILSVSNWETVKRVASPKNGSHISGETATHANTRLTALTGLLIFLLLAAEGVTVPFVGQLFTLHAFIGWLLLPPILLKISSTSYRFVMYYVGNPRYTKAGPPKPLLRIIGPLIIITTTLLMWSGIEMVLIGPHGSNIAFWGTIHKASFIFWFGLMAVHVLAYFLKAGTLSISELARRSGAHSVRTSGRLIRLAVVAGSLVLGAILGLHQWHLTGPWVAMFADHQKFG